MTKTKIKTVTPAARKLDQSDIQMFPLSKLRLSPVNPRQDVTAEEIEALALSIQLVGLLHNLIGIAQDDHAEIAAGGRRLRALWLLAERGEIDAESYAVPVRPAPDAATALQWAIAENVAREAVNPADEVAAYARHIDDGANIETVAKVFAVTVRHVKGRLRLAKLAPVILEALKAGEITLDMAAAFTVSNDQPRQVREFEACKHQPWIASPDRVRRRLTEELTPASDRLASFVGRDAYEAAGGKLRADLFEDDVWFLNRDVLESVALEKLNKVAEGLKAEGWSWSTSQTDTLSFSEMNEFVRIYPDYGYLTDAEEQRYDELVDKVEDGEASDEEKAEFEALAAREHQETWSDAQKAVAGAIVAIDYNGKVNVEAGLIRPGDQEKAAEHGVIKSSQVIKAESSKTASKGKAAFAQAMLDDMAVIRTVAVQTAMLDKPQLALDLLIFALGSGHLMVGTGLNISASPHTRDVTDAGKLQSDDRLKRELGKTPARPQYAKAFQAFLDLPRKEKTAQLAGIVSRCLSGSLAGQDPIFDMLATLTDAKPRAVWTPDADFFNRLKRDQLAAITKTLAPKHASGFQDWKKRDQVKFLHALFTDQKARAQQSADVLSRVDIWTPAEMKNPAESAAKASKAPQAKAA